MDMDFIPMLMEEGKVVSFPLENLCIHDKKHANSCDRFFGFPFALLPVYGFAWSIVALGFQKQNVGL